MPRVSRLMALAIRLDQLIRDGVVADQAELAKLGHVTRARLTQILRRQKKVDGWFHCVRGRAGRGGSRVCGRSAGREDRIASRGRCSRGRRL